MRLHTLIPHVTLIDTYRTTNGDGGSSIWRRRTALSFPSGSPCLDWCHCLLSFLGLCVSEGRRVEQHGLQSRGHVLRQGWCWRWSGYTLMNRKHARRPFWKYRFLFPLSLLLFKDHMHAWRTFLIPFFPPATLSWVLSDYQRQFCRRLDEERPGILVHICWWPVRLTEHAMAPSCQ